VNIWPRAYQQPTPPVWVSGRSPGNIREIAAKGHVFATFMSGAETTGMFAAYREAYAKAGLGEASPDRLAYLGLVAVAETREKAMERARAVASYLDTSAQVHPHFRNPPGYMPAEITAKTFRKRLIGMLQGQSGKTVDAHNATIEELMDGKIMFVGTPDEVYEQIAEFSDSVGGFGNLLMMGHAGALSHEDTVDNLTLFGQEVLPRLKTLGGAVRTRVPA